MANLGEAIRRGGFIMADDFGQGHTRVGRTRDAASLPNWRYRNLACPTRHSQSIFTFGIDMDEAPYGEGVKGLSRVLGVG
jgi:hypothetical protein